ncbi:hypothetical protein KY335_02635 [Candidatus Woesearchaeota archaeon]|nr:hypothetical protein [Candidatus Woesearchaeota archaeon]
MNVKELIAKIKEKKELSAVEDRFVRAEIIKYFKQNPKALQAVSEGRTRSEEYKQTVKNVRAVLRRIYGIFLTKAAQDRERYLESGDYEKILETHLSTKERLPSYPVIYEKIFAVTGEPAIILDLGCGMNPLSYPFMKTDAEYYASELNETDCDFLDKCFKKMGIKGKATPLDLVEAAKNPELLKVFPKADVCFLFKVLDEIERKKGRKTSEALIKAIDAKWLVISFSMKTLQGGPMRKPYRRWLEQMLTRLGYEFEMIKEGNEIFYVVKKSL